MLASAEINFRDSRTQRVLGFLMAKGLLVGHDLPLCGDAKLNIDDVLWVAKNVEPRVFEVFPAALIHFPRTFLRKNFLPEDLKEVVKAIRAGKSEGPDFLGMRYRDMRKWANRATTDGRTKPIDLVRVNKTFRLAPAAVAALERRALKQAMTKSRFLEKLLLSE